jgi:hypothetical protein
MNVLDLALWWTLFYLLIALIRDGNLATGVLLTLAVLAASLLSAVVINMQYGRNEKLWRFLWVVAIREVARLPLLIHSYLSNEFVWRGERFRIHADGTATLLETTEDSLLGQHSGA